jgi:hypothetical protein
VCVKSFEEVVMIDRRQLLAAGGWLSVLGTRTAEASPSGESAASGLGQQFSPQTAQEIVAALKDVRTAVVAGPSFSEILPVRAKQLEFLKANGKFPDFIDVGSDVWFAVHDWHVRLLQQLVFGRDPGGRYTLMLGFTALVLRPEAIVNFISTPYDNR